MDFSISEEQKLFKQSVTEFARNEIQPGATERDAEARFDRDVWDKAAEFGLMGLPFPEELGGSDASVFDTCLAGEALGYGSADMGFCLSWGAHVAIGGVPIWQLGNDEQQKKYIPRIASGEWIAGLGLTEPEAGSDAAGIKTTAEKKDGYYVLNGTKTFITNGQVGNVFVVLAVTDKEKGPGGISGFIVEKDFPGFSVGNEIHKMGHRSSPTSELIFDNCEVPAENLLGVENEGFMGVALTTLEWERSVLLAAGVGGMELQLEQCIDYAKERHQFGRPIASFQAMQFKLADLKVWLETSRLIVYKVAWNKDQGIMDPMLASIAKLFVSEVGVQAADQATQVFGGYGYTKDYPIERSIRDAKLGTLGGGTSEIQRWIIGRLLIGK
ncbi:MAG: acyl-CoA dehydrogenase family protein [Actinobacteria bacterium]|nr:acyl-CoA dehydrogenase family protein [Actinomycetota bacterium]MCG2818965.1 acyl-CoA dehydrogenase family protein [Actinomycetes bacterium]MBU4219526.1 acyl-CoA dehydrogenase family protein [Actinomycetota bacterium]MBU4359114.1 acyl-CoA dehydrogenase family protein [Actinomycetota bacterium]MBU4392735.1 acyl-CoA dehydrogenase family protein [Actinomycetota bacterium]